MSRPNFDTDHIKREAKAIASAIEVKAEPALSEEIQKEITEEEVDPQVAAAAIAKNAKKFGEIKTAHESGVVTIANTTPNIEK